MIGNHYSEGYDKSHDLFKSNCFAKVRWIPIAPF
jgi:hypothetical protein